MKKAGGVGSEANMLAEETILEYSGEDELSSVREIVFRSQNVSGFVANVTNQLANLELLSLSHNRVISLQSFVSLTGLVELNLNFNSVVSLNGLCLPLLKKLFLSNNKIVTVEGLGASLPELRTLCLYRNCISDLPRALDALKGLQKLRELDLDGNPCAFDSGYRHFIVKTLRRLKALDGESLKILDRDLAAKYFEMQSSERASVGDRPTTAPVGGRKSLLQFDDGQSTFAKLQKKLPKQKKKMFRSDFLNNHPIMLEYLAAGVLKGDSESSDRGDEDVGGDSAAAAPKKSGARKSFVDRLRGNRAPTGPKATEEERHAALVKRAAEEIEQRKAAAKAKVASATTTTENGIVFTNISNTPGAGVSIIDNDGEDPSDPYVTIRKLLQVLELQQEEMELTKASGGSAFSLKEKQEMLDELEELRIENANMYMVRNENEDLRKRVNGLSQTLRDKGKDPNVVLENSRDDSMSSGSLTGFSYKLWDDNQRLKKEVASLKQRVRNPNQENNSPPRQDAEKRGKNGFFPMALEDEGDLVISEDLGEEDDAMDDDAVAALIERNAQGLREIREDLQRTKRAMDKEAIFDKSGSGSSHGAKPFLA